MLYPYKITPKTLILKSMIEREIVDIYDRGLRYVIYVNDETENGVSLPGQKLSPEEDKELVKRKHT